MNRNDVAKVLTLGAWILAGGGLNVTGETLRVALREDATVSALVEWADGQGIDALTVRAWVADFLTEGDK